MAHHSRCAVILTGLAFSGCDTQGLQLLCTSDLRPSVVALVRDESGRPAAIGSTVAISNGIGGDGTAEGEGDSLRVFVYAANAWGTFDVRVSKPGFQDTVVKKVGADGGECAQAGLAAVSLRLEPIE